MNRSILLTLVLTLAGPLAAEGTTQPAAPTPPESEGVQGLLGLTPAQAYDKLGAPEEVFPFKAGDISWQVVHYYSAHLYLFFFQNHVWQIRLDKRYELPFLDVKMGMAKDQVLAALAPYKILGQEAEWAVFNLPYKTYPRRLRVVFDQGKLSDAYLFRGDF